MIIKKLENEEKIKAIDLAWEVFLEYEIDEELIKFKDELYKKIYSPEKINKLTIYGTFINDELIGMIAIENMTYISLFYINGKYQRKGIGTKMFEYIKTINPSNYFVLASSPYSVDFYHHLGFKDIGTENYYNGIKYVPMRIDY